MFIDTRLYNTPRWFLYRPKDYAMLVPQQLLNTVVFLGEDTGTALEIGGTAFFVSLPYTRRPQYTHVYLVTARHSLEGPRTNLVGRINRPVGEGGTVQFRLPDGDDALWLTHPEPGTGEDYVDIAAVKLPDLAAVAAHAADYGWVPLSMFFRDLFLGDDPGWGVALGDEVVAVGLLTVHYGQDKNEPVVRTGNLAMAPTEPVLVKYRNGPTRRMRLYLTELRSIAGLSGSPVFIRHRSSPGDREPAPMSLLGMMIGHWDDDDKNHMGFGKVVPARLISEVINQEAEVERRDKEEAAKFEEGGTAEADSAFGETEYERFEDLARKLVNTPKPAADEKRKDES